MCLLYSSFAKYLFLFGCKGNQVPILTQQIIDRQKFNLYSGSLKIPFFHTSQLDLFWVFS